jgi:hypothetical protein
MSEDATETTGATALETLGTAEATTEAATEATDATETFGQATEAVATTAVSDVDFGAGATATVVVSC